MKRIGFITTNKVLAQSLAAAMKNNPDLGFEPFSLLNPHQASLDAEILKINVAVIDVMENVSKETETVLLFCEELRKTVPACRLLLLVSQDDETSRKMAINAMKRKIVDDFVFYDTSLEYLYAKLAAF